MKNNLRELLDKIYELEGLVHLTLEREDKNGDFTRLISSKGKEIGDLCLALKPEIPSESSSENRNEEDGHYSSNFDEYSIDDTEETEESSDIIEKDVDSVNEKRVLQRGKLVFTINERFRFKRELFGNSDADFNNTLALVASMENYDEAEDYFLNEEGLNIDNPAVRDFLDIIKKYFK